MVTQEAPTGECHGLKDTVSLFEVLVAFERLLLSTEYQCHDLEDIHTPSEVYVGMKICFRIVNGDDDCQGVAAKHVPRYCVPTC